ncbi:MAG: DUF4405 domain-containing protein [Colwellia sp.]
MNYNNLRPYTAVTMVAVLIILVVTGWTLYLAPQGPGSRFWSLLGVNKHLYKDIHFCFGVIATLLVLLHGFLNIKPLTNYLNHESKTGVLPLLCALVVVIFTVIIALLL